MAMTAVAVRQASIVDGRKFQQWVMEYLGGGESQARSGVTLADLRYDMPKLPVAGLGEETNEDEPGLNRGPIRPEEPDNAREDH